MRARVRAVRRFLNWFVTLGKGNPTELSQCTDFSQARQTEHDIRVFMEEVSSVPPCERMTSTALYTVIKKELFANALIGKHTMQAPRMLVGVLAALHMMVVDKRALPYYLVMAWWILLQTLGTIRFSDHWSLKLADVSVSRNTLVARLSRSKMLGVDKEVTFIMILVSSCCLFAESNWLSIGWHHLK